MNRKMTQEIEGVLHALGLFGVSVSMRQLVYAVKLAYEDPWLLKDMMRGLYASVANHFEGASVSSVERNLRTLRDKVWAKGNVELLRKFAGYNLQTKPTTGEFIDIIRYHMEREGLFDHCFCPEIGKRHP